MTRRLTLPLTLDDRERPTVDAVRRRLGGRASTEPGAGELVTVRGGRGLEQIGVVIFVRGDDLDVFLEHNVVRRVRRAEALPAGDAARVPAEIAEIARDARIFAGLGERQRVRYQRDDELGEGTLIEKCRFGALVERADGGVLGVGFRRVFPAADRDQN
jgi:hypothetical protein